MQMVSRIPFRYGPDSPWIIPGQTAARRSGGTGGAGAVVVVTVEGGFNARGFAAGRFRREKVEFVLYP